MKKIIAVLAALAICVGTLAVAGAGAETSLTIGSSTATVNGTEKELDSPPILINDRTMVPLRFIMENFGFDVEWSDEDQMVTITGSELNQDPTSVKPGEDFWIAELSDSVERVDVSYKNRYGIELAGELYTPKGLNKSAKNAAVVIGAPYGGVKEQGPYVYANELAKRGFVVLTFDPSFNGESGGEPRHVSSPDIFTEDFSAGVDYLGTLDYVDREKIGAIGICGSGGFALSAAQVDTRIKAVVTASLVDISGNSATLSAEERQAALDSLAAKRWADVDNGSPEYIPTFPADTAASFPDGLDPMSAEFFEFYGLERGHHPRARGGFTTTSEAAFMNYSLLNHLDTISPRPVMMIAGENTMSKGITDMVYDQLGDNKEYITVPNANHIDLYDDVTKIPFDEIEEFLKTNLK